MNRAVLGRNPAKQGIHAFPARRTVSSPMVENAWRVMQVRNRSPTELVASHARLARLESQEYVQLVQLEPQLQWDRHLANHALRGQSVGLGKGA